MTTFHILPGSANLFGGRGVTVKNVLGRTAQDMKFPGAKPSLKMACGENPKRVYGSRGQSPATRMGNIAVDRQAWSDAVIYKRKWDDYTRKARAGTAKPADAPRRELVNDTLMGVLNGDILVENHCYRADEMANVIAMSHEFGYHVAAFHHAIESYKIADLLLKENICSAMWADWWGFKMESYDGIREDIALVHNAGACAIVHSRRPQRHPAPQPGGGEGDGGGAPRGHRHPARGRVGMGVDQPGEGARHRPADGQPRTRQDGRRRAVERRSAASIRAR